MRNLRMGIVHFGRSRGTSYYAVEGWSDVNPAMWWHADGGFFDERDGARLCAIC